MTDFKFSRTLFQLLTSGIFLYQIYSSFEKYLDKPIVQETSTVSIDDINKLPIIYICQDAQFDYAKASSNGYSTMLKFLVGNLDNSNVFTWTGKHGNQSFAKLQQFLYNVNYSSTFVHSSETRDKDYHFTQYYNDSIFIFPYGYCMKLRKPTKDIQVQSIVETDVILTDPALENQIMIPGIQYGTFGFSPTPDGLFQSYYYEIELSIHDSSVQDGRTCMDYGRAESSYGECIESVFKNTFLRWLGCLPPWVQNGSNRTCETNMIKVLSDEQIIYDISKEMDKLVTGYESDMFQQCMQPCVTMKLNYNLRRHILKRLYWSDMKLMFKEKVTVFKDVFAYDEFNLVVDIGSALGLWLGLSALSIFDHILEFYRLGRKKCCH